MIIDVQGFIYEADRLKIFGTEQEDFLDIAPNKIPGATAKLSREMKSAAKKPEFEKAAEFRNRIKNCRSQNSNTQKTSRGNRVFSC